MARAAVVTSTLPVLNPAFVRCQFLEERGERGVLPLRGRVTFTSLIDPFTVVRDGTPTRIVPSPFTAWLDRRGCLWPLGPLPDDVKPSRRRYARIPDDVGVSVLAVDGAPIRTRVDFDLTTWEGVPVSIPSFAFDVCGGDRLNLGAVIPVPLEP